MGVNSVKKLSGGFSISNCPSPCATHIPREQSSSPESIIAGDFRILTVEKRDSNLFDLFCLNLHLPGIQPSKDINWQPLQTPRLKVSFLL